MSFGTIVTMSLCVALGVFAGRLIGQHRSNREMLIDLCVLISLAVSIAVIVNRMVELWPRL